MIKRYDLINVPCHGGWDSYDDLQEVEDGGWVRYEDHAAEVERLRETFDHTRHQVCDALEVDRGLGWTSLCMEITHIYYDHATEVERLRAENERLREDLAWMTAEAHAQREAAIYGAVFANSYLHVGADVAMVHAEDAVEAWREAQKGGDDG